MGISDGEAALKCPVSVPFLSLPVVDPANAICDLFEELGTVAEEAGLICGTGWIRDDPGSCVAVREILFLVLPWRVGLLSCGAIAGGGFG